jgi:hypothetical protein
MEDRATSINERFTRVQNAVDETRLLVNDVEAHGRCWAIRIKGIKAPTHIESSDETKDHVLRFITTHLNIHNIRLEDIDTAHRLGAVKNFNQTILTRFFRRDIVDALLKVKKTLKGKKLVIHEDGTSLNRTLINDLNRRAEVEQAWQMGGKVWVKLTDGPKFKVTINDDLNWKLNPQNHQIRDNYTAPTAQMAESITHPASIENADTAPPAAASITDDIEPHQATTT